MQALFFDIDDTLYNQLEPYERAFEAVFGGKIRLDISDLFRRSRKHSDISYQLLLEGKISSERMFIYRIQKALEEFGFHAEYYQVQKVLSKEELEIMRLIPEDTIWILSL